MLTLMNLCSIQTVLKVVHGNNISGPYAKLCVPDIAKNVNLKVFNLMSRINETRQIIWHETCKCV